MPSLMLVLVAVSEELKQTDTQNCALYIRSVVPELFRVATHYLSQQLMATHLTLLGKNIDKKTSFL